MVSGVRSRKVGAQSAETEEVLEVEKGREEREMKEMQPLIRLSGHVPVSFQPPSVIRLVYLVKY